MSRLLLVALVIAAPAVAHDVSGWEVGPGLFGSPCWQASVATVGDLASPAAPCEIRYVETGPAGVGAIAVWTGAAWTLHTIGDTGPAPELADADGDTYVRTEESPDEDRIRFGLGLEEVAWFGGNLFQLQRYSDDNIGPSLRLVKARGTAAAPTATCGGDCLTGDVVGEILFGGWDAAGDAGNPGAIRLVAGGPGGNGTWGPSSRSVAWEFLTTRTNQGSPQPWLEVWPLTDGLVRFWGGAFTIDGTGKLGITNNIEVASGIGFGYRFGAETTTAKYTPAGVDAQTGMLAARRNLQVTIDANADDTSAKFLVNRDSPSIGGSNQLFAVREDGVLELPSRATSPTCSSIEEVFVHTSGALCWCDGAGGWITVATTGGGSCDA